MTGIILAGGKSSRLGKDKAFLEINGKSLIDRTVKVFRGIFSEIIIVANKPHSFLEPGVEIVTDIYPGKGALGGIYSGLFFARNERAFVAPCDMPFLNEAFIQFMVDQSDDYDVVVPNGSAGLEPLHAVYSRRCLSAIRAALGKDHLKITGFYKGLRLLQIPAAEIAPFDASGRLFRNINRLSDLDDI
ncbi:MAG: molybdenum cofactor guanylyltransferase [Smithellaceae bacterium]|nr:molybdenum cofactor guanylyltransferase [Smithellaceae bacterium]